MDATAVVHCAVYSSKPGCADIFSPKDKGFGSKIKLNLGLLPTHTSKIAPRSVKPAASTSAFKGVTKHRSTGKFEAHLWDSSHKRDVKKVTQLLYSLKAVLLTIAYLYTSVTAC